MAKSRIAIDETKIQQFIKEGRGQNEGAAYKPWLTVRDIPSLGFSSRIKGWKTGRDHHLFSNHESGLFYISDWSRSVIDIREQYPLLPLEDTLTIADACNIRHPTHPKTHKPVVLTTDFLLTLVIEEQQIEQALTVKPSKELSSQRTLEKLEIERIYWKAKNINWGIVTEREIPETLVRNIEHIHDRYYQEDLALSFKEICDIAITLTKLVKETTISLRHATQDCDHRLDYPKGTSLAVAYHLIARRYWIIDMNKPIAPGEPLNLLREDLEALHQSEIK